MKVGDLVRFAEKYRVPINEHFIGIVAEKDKHHVRIIFTHHPDVWPPFTDKKFYEVIESP